MILKYW